jgi:hypothetical protein
MKAEGGRMNWDTAHRVLFCFYARKYDILSEVVSTTNPEGMKLSQNMQ